MKKIFRIFWLIGIGMLISFMFKAICMLPISSHAISAVTCANGKQSPYFESVQEASKLAVENCIDPEMRFVKEAISKSIDPFVAQFLECGSIPSQCAGKWCEVKCVVKDGKVDLFSVSMENELITEWRFNSE